jgi:protein-S-isoprenylcysteine O-methyltransferase Ste14
MARPDLSTPEGLDAYRAELRGVAKPVRLAAFALVIIGALVVVSAVWLNIPDAVISAGYITLGLGWVLMVLAVFQRTRHHRRRMAEPE